ncbi:MAG TPA: hypothetical protein VM095_12675 [Pyrinomonadaceae bacterium]|nr:hypothetical protein [Pyrinomonadaceae bacterium]
MKRAQEKIKDLVEPRAFTEVHNYSDDPARALDSYFFTDATSDLFARWLDALSGLTANRGTTRALAGFRGVGKSHMLAAFGALAALPELRRSVADAHVATSATRLINKRYRVARVERGTHPTLQEELSHALGGDLEVWKTEPSQMLAFAAGMEETPLVLVIDTAFERERRVERDDGLLLSELANAARDLNVFVALALDDDIAGADGANVALSGTFQIDYLDPEHLYRITDTHLFQKNAQSREALREMYRTLRASVPGFNWSEPRFAAIYPMHPLIADVAPAVRLYVPTFAFLPFAAAAGAHAVNRPALSLVVLDELFDRTERELRRAESLKEAFGAYDHLARHGVSQVPVMQRLQAKLVLKGLFILSLTGRGATAQELGAAMLLYDEQHPAAAIERIEDVLGIFTQSAPPGSLLKDESEGEARYRFYTHAPAESVPQTVAAPEAEVTEGDEAASYPPPLRPVTLSDEELAEWASLLTETPGLPESVADPEARDQVRGALADWLKAWRMDNPLKHFDALMDEGLTTRVWNMAEALRKSYGAAAVSIEAALSKNISLEEGLQRVAAAFGDSPDKVAANKERLKGLAIFIEELPGREKARAYLSLADATGIDEIESARRELLAITGDVHNLFDEESRNRFNLLWHEFHSRYTEHYAGAHDETLHDNERRAQIEAETRSDEWREFEALSRLRLVNRRYWDEAAMMLDMERRARCELPVRQLLTEHSLCACGFRLASAEVLARLPQDLREIVERGRAAYRRTLLFLSTPLAIALDALARKDVDGETAIRARSLSGAFAQGVGPQQFSVADVQLIESALARMTAPPPVRLHLPVNDYGLLTRDELRARLNQWLDDLPNEPALVEVVEREDADGS